MKEKRVTLLAKYYTHLYRSMKYINLEVLFLEYVDNTENLIVVDIFELADKKTTRVFLIYMDKISIF